MKVKIQITDSHGNTHTGTGQTVQEALIALKEYSQRQRGYQQVKVESTLEVLKEVARSIQ